MWLGKAGASCEEGAINYSLEHKTHLWKAKTCYSTAMANSSATPNPVLTKISPSENHRLSLIFDNGEEYQVPYLDLRFECPCANCVDEITGQRTLKRGSIKPDIKPMKVEPVGRYAIHIKWSDGHSTGMYHFDRLYEIAKKSRTSA
jgi:DUF971 family protein